MESMAEKPGLIALGLVLLTLLVYQPVWHNGYIWDDDAYVTENMTLRSMDGLRRIWLEPSATRRYYPLLVVLFVCALLSKTVTCSLPAVLLLILWWKKGKLEKRDMVELAPLFILGATLGLTTAWLEKHYAGASGSGWSLSIIER